MTVIQIKLDDETLDRLAHKVASQVGTPAAPYLNIDQAAEYLACERHRIYDLVRLGQVQVARDGRRLLFRREWLDQALEAAA